MHERGLLALSEAILSGDASIEDHHPFSASGVLEEVADGVGFVEAFANVNAFAVDDQLVLIDTGSQFHARAVHDQVRRWTPNQLHTAVYTHGHADHVFGVPAFEEESAGQGWARPHVIAHELTPPRFDRYQTTAGYNGVINARQFQVPGLRWPTDYRYPDQTYEDELVLEVGGERFELWHAMGETDDHTITWIPSRKVLCCGDLFIWCSPNAGNPQKVQRYPLEWAAALRRMAGLGAELLLPGHGLPIAGADHIRTVLLDTAEYLQHIHDGTLTYLNQGARLDEVLRHVQPPAHLLDKPYLQPVYDEPEFIVRNVWRRYGGWYDGDPSHLKPAPAARVAEELAALAGGADRLAERALTLAEAGLDSDLRLAAHLVELASQAAPDDLGVQAARAEVFERRRDAATSTMAKGVFAWAAKESRDRIEDATA